MARSRDGLRWLKLGKIIGGGARGGFDELGAMNALVVRNRKDGKYVMAYEGVAADGRRSIGMAVSADGLKDWRRLQAGPVLLCCEDGWDNEGVGSPCLVQMDGEADEWRLYYRGVGKGGQTGIGMAVSEDRAIGIDLELGHVRSLSLLIGSAKRPSSSNARHTILMDELKDRRDGIVERLYLSTVVIVPRQIVGPKPQSSRLKWRGKLRQNPLSKHEARR
ncbi:hypothetical protein RJ639_002428 [Escallonia herrerae]|uniref:Glycosyl hydrolase family 32 N-terminal domain-containing protein n=1 Tax=Escallonia herrerae TaxID=1293975 RepID=A0AA88X9A3_9ASTE|nr:hypothetical protein RJ639_002428 [Escallonia herrerae]